MKEWTITEIVAACFWFNGQATIKSVARYIDISEKDVQEIRKSNEYRENVKALMLTARSPAEKIKDWIRTYPRNEMPESFGKRMGLKPHVVKKLIKEVEEVLSSLPSE